MVLDDKVCCRLISGGISEFGGCVMWPKRTTPNRRDFPVTSRLRGADQLVTSFLQAAEKVRPNASLAAHGAAPQRKIDPLRPLWPGGKPFQRFFSILLVSCPSSSRHKSGPHFFTQRRSARKEYKEKPWRALRENPPIFASDFRHRTLDIV